MYQDIRNNKIKTGFIVSLFIIVIALIIYYICMAFDLGYMSIIIAMVFSIGSAWASYYYSDKIVLSINRAHPASPEEYQKLNNILDGLMVSSGLEHRPRLYVVNDPQPNAFATGRNPKNAVICVTTGLLEKMDYYELEGVVAHELSHIKNYDIRLSAVVSVMVGFMVILTDWVSRALFWGRFGDNDNDSGSRGNPILMLIGLVCLILAPIFGQLMQLALSRRREFLADASAVELTRNPDGMISALQKLDADTNQLRTANNSTAHMYIVSPFKSNLKDGKKRKTSLFSTHPSIDDRIEAIRNLK
jgi:heat shock protein HtpX